MPKRILLAGLMCVTAGLAYAEPADEGRQVIEQWATSFNAGDLEGIVSTYSPQAILWGTVSRTRASSTEELRAYFTPAVSRKVRVELGEHTLRVTEGVVVDAGQYTFKTPAQDGTVRETPSRYHFVAVRTASGWKIIAHHSSVLPAPPPN